MCLVFFFLFNTLHFFIVGTFIYYFFLGIIALNAAVLCCWRIPSMQRSMLKYFTSNPASSEFTCATRSCPLCVCSVCIFFPSPLPLPETRCLPMALSSFSHYSIIHMVANMYVLWIFSSGIVSLLGKEQFLAVYLSAGESNKAHNWSLITFIKSKHNT